MAKHHYSKFEQIIVKFFNSDCLVLPLFVLMGSIAAVCTKFEFGWDFINYHYYNAFAFLYNRLNYDIVPASVNTFFNPLIDLPWYFIVDKFNDMPNVAYALQGIWFGLLLFAFFKFCRLFFELKNGRDVIAIIILLLVAMTGHSVFFQIGTSTNEIQIALLEFVALYLLFGMIKMPEKQRGWLFFAIGLLLGVGLGLKATILYVCLSAGLNLMICYRYLTKPVVFISFFAFGGLIGYLITNGWWMYKMWNLYSNPFFPFLNGLFHSPYFDDANFSDKRFMPPLHIALFYPLMWTFSKYHATEQYFFDFHTPLFYIFGVGCLVYWFCHRNAWLQFKQNRLWCFYAVFLLLSYVLWLVIFSIGRYLIVIEMMSAIFLVKIIRDYIENQKYGWEFIVAFMVPLLLGILYTPFCSQPFVGRTDNSCLIEVENIKLPPRTLVKLYGLPLSGFVPSLARYNDIRVLGYSQLYNVHQNHSDFAERGRFKSIRDKIEAEHKGVIVVLYRDVSNRSENYERFHQALDKEIANMYCRELKYNFERGAFICVPPELKTEILGDS